MTQVKAYSILIVEDNEGLARLMQKNLERLGYETHIAGTSWEARDYIKASHEKLLMLLDYKLGDIPASELLDELEASQHCVPFIVVTGKGSEEIAVDMMKRGARDYVIKNPNLVDLLPGIVEQVIDDLEREQKRKIYGTPDVHGRQL